MDDTRPLNLWPVLGALALLLIGGEGLLNALDNAHSATTDVQWVMVALQLGYAVFSPVPIVARWKLSSLTFTSLLLWGALLTADVFLAPIAWGAATLATGALSALGAAGIAALVGWLLCRGWPAAVAR